MNLTLNPSLLSTAVDRAIVGGPDEDLGVKRFLIVLPGDLANAIGIAGEIELVVRRDTHKVRFCLSEANDPAGRTVLRCAWEPAEAGMEAVGYRYATRNPAHAALDLVRIRLEQMLPLGLAA